MLSKLKSISKRAIILSIVAALAIGGAAYALGTATTSAVVQLTATEDTQLLPGRYRNYPQYFYAQYETEDAQGDPKTVYVPAGHGDTLVNSYDYNQDGSVTLLLQKGKVAAGPYTVTTYFSSFIVTYYDDAEEESVITDNLITDLDSSTGYSTVTLPAEAVNDAQILVSFIVGGSPSGHTSTAYLILNPELVQVAFTRP
jgi:hypothetical protein